jgi:hypothetical protein
MNSVQVNTEKSGLRHDYNNSVMPVIKLNFNGEIIYANMSSFDLLISWKCFVSSRLPKHIYENIRAGKHSFGVNYKDKIINFVVVPFPEGGYIGLHALSMRSNQLNN